MSFIPSYDYSSLRDTIGRFRTVSLFWETRNNVEQYPPLFTTKDHDIVKDGITYLSLKSIYMSYSHAPNYEYEFAMDVFNSWEHWVELSTNSNIAQIIAKWRDELEVKLKAKSIKGMMNLTDNVNALRYLAEKGYETKRGRPTKAEVERERKIAAGVDKELNDDFNRIQHLKVVN